MGYPGRFTLAIIVAWAVTAPGSMHGQVNVQSVDGLPNPYQTITNFFKLPAGQTIGATAGVEVDRDGSSIWVFERCGAPNRLPDPPHEQGTCVGSTRDPILKFDSSGRVVKSFGAGMFVYPHGMYVDREGNVWVTDALASPPARGVSSPAPSPKPLGHQVIKFSPEGKVLLALGKPGIAGSGPDTFNMPSDVLVAPNGDIFVADGHGGDSNARMLKFTKDGKFIKSWGKKGSARGDFDSPHTLAMDSRGRLFVGDRSNNRIQIFDQEGTFLEEWRQFGRPSGVFIDRNDVIYVADSLTTPANNPGGRRGIRIGSAKDGKVTAFISDPDPDGIGEGLVTDAQGNLYSALTTGMALKKYVKRR
jgi:sugar lactone lactonase YvrE